MEFLELSGDGDDDWALYFPLTASVEGTLRFLHLALRSLNIDTNEIGKPRLATMTVTLQSETRHEARRRVAREQEDIYRNQADLRKAEDLKGVRSSAMWESLTPIVFDRRTLLRHAEASSR